MKNIGNNPTVTIVVPLYNYSSFIKDCILSIKNQTYTNWELIMVDDASVDSSLEIAKRYESDRIRVIHFKNNKGYSVAKNEGIIASKGSWITILDADDMLTKKSLEIRLEAAILKEADFIYSNAISIYDKTTLNQCYKIKKNLKIFNKERHLKKKSSIIKCSSIYGIHAQTVLVNRRLYEKFGLYDESLKSRSDREMWWRFSGRSKDDEVKVKNYYLDEAVAYYRYHKRSMTCKRVKDKKYDKKVRILSEKQFNIRNRDGITVGNTRFLQ